MLKLRKSIPAVVFAVFAVTSLMGTPAVAEDSEDDSIITLETGAGDSTKLNVDQSSSTSGDTAKSELGSGKTNSKPLTPEQIAAGMAFSDGCADARAIGNAPAECQPQAVAARPTVSPAVVARQAALELQVPEPVFSISPDPADNEWNILPIGMPAWVGEPSPATSQAASVTSQGISISMTANRASATVDFGDGTVVQCSSMTTRPVGADPYAESPDCGHTYMEKGTYTVTVTGSWTVTWSAAGQTGTVQLSSSSSRTIQVGELVTVLVPAR